MKKNVTQRKHFMWYLVMLLFVIEVFPQVNMVTGNASQAISFISGFVALQYDGKIAKSVKLPNETAPTSWKRILGRW